MLGFKIFDNDSKEKLLTILDFAQKENLTLEIALYNQLDETLSFKEFMQNNEIYKNIKNKSIHLDYKKYIGGELDKDSILKFKEELQIAKDLGIHKAVLHYQTPSTFKNHLKQLEDDTLKQNLKLIADITKEYDIYIYIENTYIYQRKTHYNDLIYHRKIWDTVIDLNLQSSIGICLDWGHVKAFANDDLEDWILYCKDLRENGMHIYMHVHDNDGIKDLHETLHDGRKKGFDNIKGNKPFIGILKKYIDDFKEEPLILEYTSDLAIDAYLLIKEELHLEQ